MTITTLMLAAALAVQPDETGMFPFLIRPDAADTAADMSALLPKLGATEDGASFDAAVTVTVGVESRRVPEFLRAVSEATGGRVSAQTVATEERPL